MENKVMNRMWVVVGAIVIQLCLGAIYAWSVFTPALKMAGWSKTQTQVVFGVGLFFFALFTIIAGRLMPKWGPRKLAISGGILLGLAYVLGGVIGPDSFMILAITLGVIGGAGIGLAYVVPIAVGMRWFPDKKGLITGLAVAGFGFGATLWVKLAGAWGHLIETQGLGFTFILYGIIFGIAVVLGGMAMVFPPEGYKPEGWNPPEPVAGATGAGEVNFTANEMIKTPQYFMIFFAFVFGAGAGLMSIGLMKLFPSEALMANGHDAAAASAIAGTAMAIFFSLANGIGRIAWGSFTDKLGAKNAMILMLAVQGVTVIAFPYMAGSEYMLYLGATIIGFNFGGNFALFPLMTASTFGTKNVGFNYGWVFFAYGIGGILFPIMGGALGQMGNFPLAFIISGVTVLVAAALVFMVKQPQKA